MSGVRGVGGLCEVNKKGSKKLNIGGMFRKKGVPVFKSAWIRRDALSTDREAVTKAQTSC